MPTSLHASPVFGPVRSRRLGLSLGINLLPGDGKVCNFNCIYCECGLNEERRPHTPLPTKEAVLEALQRELEKLQQAGDTLNVMTFAGNGEPTLHPKFSEIVQEVAKLRDRWAPQAQIAVLTNGTTILREETYLALQQIEQPIVKLDTVNLPFILRTNQPTGHYDVTALAKRMAEFQRETGRLIIQTIFLQGVLNDGTPVSNLSEEHIRPWLDVVKTIQPKQVMIYTIDRETPLPGLRKATKEQLDAILQRLLQEQIPTTVAY